MSLTWDDMQMFNCIWSACVLLQCILVAITEGLNECMHIMECLKYKSQRNGNISKAVYGRSWSVGLGFLLNYTNTTARFTEKQTAPFVGTFLVFCEAGSHMQYTDETTDVVWSKRGDSDTWKVWCQFAKTLHCNS